MLSNWPTRTVATLHNHNLAAWTVAGALGIGLIACDSGTNVPAGVLRPESPAIIGPLDAASDTPQSPVNGIADSGPDGTPDEDARQILAPPPDDASSVSAADAPIVVVDARRPEPPADTPDGESDSPLDVQTQSCSAISSCAGPPPTDAGANAVCMTTVDVTVVNHAGNPVSGLAASVCDKSLCKRSISDSVGKLHFAVCKVMVNPTLDITGRDDYSSFAIPIPSSPMDFGTIKVFEFPKPGHLIKPSAGQALTLQSGDVTLHVSPDAEILTEDGEDPNSVDLLFRTVEVPVQDAKIALASGPGFDMVYGLAPVNMTISPPAAVSVPNRLHWPANTPVEFYHLVLDALTEGTAPLASWVPIATGVVSPDASVIASNPDPDKGIRYFSVLGIRKKTPQ